MGKIGGNGEAKTIQNHGLHGLGKDKRMLRMNAKITGKIRIHFLATKEHKRNTKERDIFNHGLHE
jgi:hypothetical protein